MIVGMNPANACGKIQIGGASALCHPLQSKAASHQILQCYCIAVLKKHSIVNSL